MATRRPRQIWSLTLESRALLRQVLAEEAIDCDYREPGLLHLALGAEQHAHLAQTVAALRADAFAADLLDRDQVQELVNTPLGPEISGGLFAPENGLLHPARLVLGLADAARRRGAQIYEGAPVLHIEGDGAGVQVQTARGELRARAAVVALNAWSDQLIPALRGAITPVRGQVLAYAPMPPLFRCGMGAALTPTGEYWQQALDGTIVLGGCRAAAPGGDVGVRTVETTPEVQAALEEVFPRLFPALRGRRDRLQRRWAGLDGLHRRCAADRRSCAGPGGRLVRRRVLWARHAVWDAAGPAAGRGGHQRNGTGGARPVALGTPDARSTTDHRQLTTDKRQQTGSLAPTSTLTSDS